MLWLSLMAGILAVAADTVTEVVVGIPVPVKERKEAGYAHH
jgi:adenosylcobinamide kinase/adenosylcobinamide-phosphate guanylyltransferase